MSLNSLAAQVLDEAFRSRVNACGQQEAAENPALADDEFARQVREGASDRAVYVLIWPVAVATEAEYASALASDNPNPGGDEAAVTDGMILAAVQANWPTVEVAP